MDLYDAYRKPGTLNFHSQMIKDEDCETLANWLSNPSLLIKIEKRKIRTTITSLVLQGNFITCVGCTVLCRVLEHTKITNLDLNFNIIGDAGCRALAEVLPRTSIQTLSLWGNDITTPGCMPLIRAIWDSKLDSLVLGVTVLGERLRRGQWVAIALAGVGVAILSIDLGSLPWISLFLAVTFGLYGLVRKTAPVESLDGLTLEVAAMAPFAAIALGMFTADGDGLSTVIGLGGWAWVAGASLMTAAPLLLFGWAARRIPLSLVGVLQYLTPTLQFLLGVLAYDESWSGGQVVGYVVIWTGLVLFAADGLATARHTAARRDVSRR